MAVSVTDLNQCLQWFTLEGLFVITSRSFNSYPAGPEPAGWVSVLLDKLYPPGLPVSPWIGGECSGTGFKSEGSGNGLTMFLGIIV